MVRLQNPAIYADARPQMGIGFARPEVPASTGSKPDIAVSGGARSMNLPIEFAKSGMLTFRARHQCATTLKQSGFAHIMGTYDGSVTQVWEHASGNVVVIGRAYVQEFAKNGAIIKWSNAQ